MAPINSRQAAVVDPILSTHARGYRNAEFIAPFLFPRATVPNRAMRQLKFGKESFRLMNTKRAPGSNVKRIQYGYASEPISLVQDCGCGDRENGTCTGTGRPSAGGLNSGSCSA